MTHKPVYLLIAVLFLFSVTIHASGRDTTGKRSSMAISGYSGGMMLHTGYLKSGVVNFPGADGAVAASMRMEGMTIGIGGAARVHFGKHLRVGAEGYASDLYYGVNHSYEVVGWGGLLADCAWPVKRWTPFAGATIGGGAVKNVTALEITTYHHYSFFTIVPFAGVEYALSKTLHLAAKIDYMFNVSNPQADYAKGVRIYFGLMFCH